MKKLSIIVIAVVIVALIVLLATVTKTPGTQGSELPQAGGSATTEAVDNSGSEETIEATASSEATEPAATTPDTTEPAADPTEPTKNNKVDTVVKDEPADKDEDIKVEISGGNDQATPDTPSDNDSSFVIDFDDLLNAANK